MPKAHWQMEQTDTVFYTGWVPKVTQLYILTYLLKSFAQTFKNFQSTVLEYLHIFPATLSWPAHTLEGIFENLLQYLHNGWFDGWTTGSFQGCPNSKEQQEVCWDEIRTVEGGASLVSGVWPGTDWVELLWWNCQIAEIFFPSRLPSLGVFTTQSCCSSDNRLSVREKLLMSHYFSVKKDNKLCTFDLLVLAFWAWRSSRCVTHSKVPVSLTEFVSLLDKIFSV